MSVQTSTNLFNPEDTTENSPTSALSRMENQSLSIKNIEALEAADFNPKRQPPLRTLLWIKPHGTTLLAICFPPHRKRRWVGIHPFQSTK